MCKNHMPVIIFYAKVQKVVVILIAICTLNEQAKLHKPLCVMERAVFDSYILYQKDIFASLEHRSYYFYYTT
jgi:hypothetical protein